MYQSQPHSGWDFLFYIMAKDSTTPKSKRVLGSPAKVGGRYKSIDHPTEFAGEPGFAEC